MSLQYHALISGPDAYHPIIWIGSADPAGDPANNVQPFAWWLDTTSGTTLHAGAILKYRNAGNTAWTTVEDLATTLGGYQPLDSDLTAIAALSTTSFGRSLLALADAAAGRTALSVYSSAQVDSAIAAAITGGASDVMLFKGVIDCSANPNYPAADAGNLYKVSVAGKIGGASGPNVEVGDTLYCITDSTASGTQAAVGANWVIVQENIDGAVVGPASAVDNAVALFDGTTGKLIKDSGLLFLLAALGDVNLGSLTDGEVLTWHAASSKWINAAPSGGGGGGGGTRTAATVTTASLANNANETGSVALAKGGIIYFVTVDRDCWVRLYATSADQVADASRVLGASAPATTNILFEESFASGGSQTLRRLAVPYYNGDGTPATAIYYNIVNKSGSASTVQVQITHLPLES